MPPKKGDAPAFQHYAGDWIAQTATLTPAARGILSTLRALAWIHRQLPMDLAGLARLAQVTRAEMNKAWPSISGWFETAPEGGPWLIEPQLELQRAELERHRESQKNKAEERWKKERSKSGRFESKPARSSAASDAAASSRHTAGHMPGDMPSGCSSPSSSSSGDREDVVHTSPSVARPLGDYQRLQTLWQDKTGLTGILVPGMIGAREHIEAYIAARPGDQRDPWAIAAQAIDALVRYCETRTPGYQPPPTGVKMIEHWAHIERVLNGGEIVPSPRPQDSEPPPTMVTNLDFSKRKGGA